MNDSGKQMPQFLYRLTPTRFEMVTVGPTLEEQAIGSEYFAHLSALTEQGVVQSPNGKP